MVMDIKTTMNIILTHAKTLNLGILTLVTHPRLEMIVATPLRINANAPAHLILIIRIVIIVEDSIDPDVIRASAEVDCTTKVVDVGHLDPPTEWRCRYSELLLLIISRHGSCNMTTTIIRGVHLTDIINIRRSIINIRRSSSISHNIINTIIR
jgi:hypothetical protein